MKFYALIALLFLFISCNKSEQISKTTVVKKVDSTPVIAVKTYTASPVIPISYPHIDTFYGLLTLRDYTLTSYFDTAIYFFAMHVSKDSIQFSNLGYRDYRGKIIVDNGFGSIEAVKANNSYGFRYINHWWSVKIQGTHLTFDSDDWKGAGEDDFWHFEGQKI
jgi:hypothetical protein